MSCSIFLDFEVYGLTFGRTPPPRPCSRLASQDIVASSSLVTTFDMIGGLDEMKDEIMDIVRDITGDTHTGDSFACLYFYIFLSSHADMVNWFAFRVVLCRGVVWLGLKPARSDTKLFEQRRAAFCSDRWIDPLLTSWMPRKHASGNKPRLRLRGK